MNIFLTGSTGMVGHNLLEKAKTKFNFFAPKRNELNLLNFSDVYNYLENKNIALVIHTAGTVGGIHANMNNQAKFLTENWQIGQNVILAAQKCGIKKLINLGSSCMYPKYSENPIKETALLKGELEATNEGYALAKVAIAKLCQYISNNSNIEYKTIIPCNLYGIYDHFEEHRSHLIAAIIAKLHKAKIDNHKVVTIWGDGLARREFLFTEDFTNLLIKAIGDFSNLPELMNVGADKDYRVNEYYEIAAEVVGYDGKFTHDLSKPSGMQKKLVDSSLAKKFGWQAKTSLIEGLQKTYEYYLHTIE